MTRVPPLLAVDIAAVGAAVALALIGVIAAGVVLSYFSGVAPVVERHTGRPWKRSAVITRPLLQWERVNLYLALEALRTAVPPGHPVIGMGYWNELTPALAATASRHAPVEYGVRPVSLTASTKVVVSGLYLLAPPGLAPFAAMLSRTSLDVLAPTADDAQKALDAILSEARERNAFRGQVLMVEQAAPAAGRATACCSTARPASARRW